MYTVELFSVGGAGGASFDHSQHLQDVGFVLGAASNGVKVCGRIGNAIWDADGHMNEQLNGVQTNPAATKSWESLVKRSKHTHYADS